MSDINIDQVLINMRAMSNEAGSSRGVNKVEGSESFASLLKQSINKVNEIQQTSGRLTKEFEIGESDVSLAEVMISSQKAGIAFQAVLQVRNKLTDAYREIMNLPM